MHRSIRAWWLAALLVPTVAVAGAKGQATGGFGGGMGGLSPPRFEPEGAWARVLSVTPKWLVLQNAAGQQFPVSSQAVEAFLVRWPTTPGRLGPDAVAEVTGVDLDSGRVMASHVDIYQGQARALVAPTSRYLVGFNRVVTPLSPFQMYTYNTFDLLPGEELIPRRRHVVGPVINPSPLALAVQGEPAAVVVPGPGGMSVSEVTLGGNGFVRPGDLAWFLPAAANPESLALARLVVYKDVPIDQFVP